MYKADLDTAEGMKLAANHYGIKDWEFDQNEPIWKNNENLKREVVLNGNKNKYISLTPWEGCQRLGSCEHFIYASPIDPHEGTLQPGKLTLEHLQQYFPSTPQKKNIKDTDVITRGEKLRTQKSVENMHSRTIEIKIDYVINRKVNADDVCERLRTMSAGKANEKLKSASKEIMEVIADKAVKEIFDNICLQNLYDLPKFNDEKRFKQGKLKYFDKNKVTAKWAELNEGKDMTQDERLHWERELYVQWAPIIDHEDYQKYLKNINDVHHLNRARDLLKAQILHSVHQVEFDPDDMERNAAIKPPFVPTFETQSRDAVLESGGVSKKNCEWLNAKTANNLLIAPRVLLALYAGYKNINVDDAQKKEGFMNLLNYYMKYCVHGNVQANSVDLHGAYNVIYNCSNDVKTYTNEGQIVGAALFITEMIASCITQELEMVTDTIEAREETWKNALRMIRSAILIMSTKKVDTNDGDIIGTLGKYPPISFLPHVYS